MIAVCKVTIKAPWWAALWGLPLLAMFSACADQTPWRNATPRLLAPDRYQLTRDTLVFHSDFPLVAQHRLVEDLVARRGDLRVQL